MIICTVVHQGVRSALNELGRLRTPLKVLAAGRGQTFQTTPRPHIKGPPVHSS